MYIYPEPSPLSVFPQEANETAHMAVHNTDAVILFIIVSPFHENCPPDTYTVSQDITVMRQGNNSELVLSK